VPVSSPHPWVSIKIFPIVVITFPTESTVKDTLSMTNAMRHFSAGITEPIAIMSDLSGVRSSDPETRAIYVEFVRDMKRVAGQWVRGTAVISQSTLQRTILNLHAALVGSTPYPVRAFASQSQALPWLYARLTGTKANKATTP
jgi:hypothetical protein